jgi:hypothetical protein
MEYGDLDKMRAAWENRPNKDPMKCKHEWDYMIFKNSNGGNAFIEFCPLCFNTQGTIESVQID